MVLGRVEASDDKGFEARIKEAITRFGITDPMRTIGWWRGGMTTPQSRNEIFGPKSFGLACHELSVLTDLGLVTLPTQSRRACDLHQESAGAGDRTRFGNDAPLTIDADLQRDAAAR